MLYKWLNKGAMARYGGGLSAAKTRNTSLPLPHSMWRRPDPIPENVCVCVCVCCELAWAAASYLCCPSEEIQSIMPRLQTHLLICVHVLNSSPIFSIYSESNFVFKLTPCTLHTNCKLDTLRWVLCTRRFLLASDQEAGKEGTLARP